MAMKMILKNRYFLIAVALVLIQQLLLEVSTLFIALAGEKIFSNNAKVVITYTSLPFFLFALLSYLTSSLNSFYIVKLKNSLFKAYISNIFTKFYREQKFNSVTNRENLIS